VSTSTSSDYTWADWTTGTAGTPVSPVTVATSSAYWTTASTPVAAVTTATGSGAVWSYSGTSVSPAAYTGAANANAGSFALAGLAAVVAVVVA